MWNLNLQTDNIFFFLRLHHTTSRILVPTRDWTRDISRQIAEFLTTGLPGNSRDNILLAWLSLWVVHQTKVSRQIQWRTDFENWCLSKDCSQWKMKGFPFNLCTMTAPNLKSLGYYEKISTEHFLQDVYTDKCFQWYTCKSNTAGCDIVIYKKQGCGHSDEKFTIPLTISLAKFMFIKALLWWKETEKLGEPMARC